MNIWSIIGMILAGIVAGYLVSVLQKKFKEVFIKKLQEQINGVSTTESQKVEEVFSIKKFISGIINITSKVNWAKDIVSIFNLRKFIIVGVIIGVIYGAGWFMGIRNKPVMVNLEGKEATIKLNEHYLHIDKMGNTCVQDKDGKILKTIKVKDIPELERALRPYGVDIKYFVTTGASVGNIGKFEAGAGVQSFKYYKWTINHFLTNAGVYPMGLGYKVTDNFDIMLGAGLGYDIVKKGEVDKRYGIYGKWKF